MRSSLRENVGIVLIVSVLSVSLGVSALAVVVLGIIPNSLYQWALNAAAPILP